MSNIQPSPAGTSSSPVAAGKTNGTGATGEGKTTIEDGVVAKIAGIAAREASDDDEGDEAQEARVQ